MKRSIFIIIVLSLLFACKTEKTELKQKKWVYLEAGPHGIYGEISQEDLNNIKNKSDLDKLILVENVRFIDNDSIVRDISIDSNEKGTSFYKIKNINYMEILKNDPINTKVEFKVTE